MIQSAAFKLLADKIAQARNLRREGQDLDNVQKKVSKLFKHTEQIESRYPLVCDKTEDGIEQI